MAETTNSTRLDELVKCFREAAAQVFSQALSSPWSVELRSEGLPADDGFSRSSVTFALSGALHGNIAIGIRNADAVLLAQKFLAEPPDTAAELNGERTEAFEELMRQVGGVAVTGMKPRFGEVQAEVRMDKPVMRDEVTVVLSASESASGAMCLEMRVDKDLIQDPAPAAEIPASAPVAASAAEIPSPPPVAVEEDDGKDKLGRLVGVNLKMALQFGQTFLTLRQLLNLHPGVIIELDRQVEEPVDLLVDSGPIARGDVVVVAGKYGIRISELVNAQALD